MSKTTISGLIGKRQVQRATYDFDTDGGAKATPIDLFTLKENTIVHDFWFEVETAALSTGLATLEVGVTGGTTSEAMKQLGKAEFAADRLGHDDDKGAALWDDTDKHSIRKKYTAETDLSLLIGTEDLSQGKIHFYVEYSAGY